MGSLVSDSHSDSVCLSFLCSLRSCCAAAVLSCLLHCSALSRTLSALIWPESEDRPGHLGVMNHATTLAHRSLAGLVLS